MGDSARASRAGSSVLVCCLCERMRPYVGVRMLHSGVHDFAQGSGIEISRRPFHEKHCITLRNAFGQLSAPALAESLLMHSSSSPPFPPTTVAIQLRSSLAAPRALRIAAAVSAAIVAERARSAL